MDRRKKIHKTSGSDCTAWSHSRHWLIELERRKRMMRRQALHRLGLLMDRKLMARVFIHRAVYQYWLVVLKCRESFTTLSWQYIQVAPKCTRTYYISTESLEWKQMWQTMFLDIWHVSKSRPNIKSHQENCNHFQLLSGSKSIWLQISSVVCCDRRGITTPYE